jgi:ubiquinone/menaquinone biosynthesis C-methylase UbiE
LTSLTFKRYLQTIDMQKLLEQLAVSNAEMVLKEIRHFTQKEAEKRDKILLGYFGEDSVNLIVDSICNRLLSTPKLREDAEILDVGAGSGFFTVKVVRKLRSKLPKAAFYAMDATPIMLKMLAKKTSEIQPFLGVAENITKSAKLARKHLRVPEKFDAMFSTLMLHHCISVEQVFQSMREALKTHGKVVVMDLCKHPFKEFRKEMGDIHLGFEPKQIEKAAKKLFTEASVEKLPGICCSSSGRCAELFIAYMTT